MKTISIANIIIVKLILLLNLLNQIKCSLKVYPFRSLDKKIDMQASNYYCKNFKLLKF